MSSGSGTQKALGGVFKILVAFVWIMGGIVIPFSYAFDVDVDVDVGLVRERTMLMFIEQ